LKDELLESSPFPPKFSRTIYEGFSWIDFDELMKIIQYYPPTSISMRLGWLLENFKKRWKVTESIFKELEKNRTESRIYLLKSPTRGNFLVKRWNLMVPKTVSNMREE
jgi:hypothetical protein